MTIKMITGEEIIGDLDSDTEDYLILDNPMHVDYFYDPINGLGMKLSPYMPTIKHRLFTLSKKHVIFYSETDESTSEYYEKCSSVKPTYSEGPSILNEADYVDLSNIDKKKLN